MVDKEDFNSFLKELKPIVQDSIEDNTEFEVIWDSVIEKFEKWQSELPAQISPVTRNLILLENLSNVFKDDSFRGNIIIKDLILSDVIAPGQTFKRTNKSGKEMIFQVVGRDITATYGILYFLKNEKGEIFTEEFRD